MTTIEVIFIIAALAFIMLGLWLLLASLKSKNKITELPDGIQEKDGIPILPRHLRNLPEDNHLIEDGLSQTDELQTDELQTDESLTEQPSLQVNKEAISNEINLSNDSNDGYILERDSVEPPVALYAGHYDTGNQPDMADSSLDALTDTFDEPVNFDESVNHNALSLDPQLMDDAPADNESLAEPTVNYNSGVDKNLPEDDASPTLMSDHEINHDTPLYTVTDTLNIRIIPNNEFKRISGKSLLKIADFYGFKFGALDMFHRYQGKDGTGLLWFSMLAMTRNEILPLKLNKIANSEYNSLILFLSLPHFKIYQGFDSMMSIATLIARELDAHIVDEEGNHINANYKKQLRATLEERNTR